MILFCYLLKTYKLYRISIGCILLEVTTNDNRALDTDLSGAGNMTAKEAYDAYKNGELKEY